MIGCGPCMASERRLQAALANEELARHPQTTPEAAGRLLLEAARWLVAAEDGRAQSLYREVAEGPQGDERDRARLELAHQRRRVDDLVGALDGYEDLAGDVHAVRGRRDAATWWCGRVHELRSDLGAARRVWARLAIGARDPSMQVRAWDRLGLLHVGLKDLDGARDVLERCDLAVSPIAAEVSDRGRRVRAVLEAMTLRRVLEGEPAH